MINDKQFIITPPSLSGEKFEVKAWEAENYRTMALDGGYVIHYHCNLKITANRNKSVVLLGHAWQVEKNSPSPEEIISNCHSNITETEIFAYEHTWCGRYIIIANSKIYLDAIGSLGIFYNDRFISSSLYVLCQVENRSVVYPNIKWGGVPDYVPGPLTPYEDTYRLLPSQILDIKEMKVSSRPLLLSLGNNYTEAQLVDEIQKTFVTSVRNMVKEFEGCSLWLALTGGRDSRLTMSLLENAKVEYKTFTCYHPHISKGDILIPQKLSRIARKEHRFLPRDESMYSKDREIEYKTHCAGMSVDADGQYYSYGQIQQLKSDKPVLIIRSGVLEISCEYLKKPNSVRDSLRKNQSFSTSHVYTPPYPETYIGKSFDIWTSIVKTDPLNHNLNFYDRLYWDQREGAWLSSIEHSYDMMDDIQSVQIWNCRYLISLLMRFDLKKRIYKEHEEIICKASFPQFRNVSYDYNFTIIKRVKYLMWRYGMTKYIKRVLGKRQK